MFKLLYKQVNESSFQCIKKYQKKHLIKKIGHTGTLDPLACGLLLIATDEDTKLIPFLKNHDKKYYVKLELGKTSLTYDAEGPITITNPNLVPLESEIKTCLNGFVGKLEQMPPAFSAKKINGKRAYDLARKNQAFELKPQIIEIKSIENIKYKYPFVEFETLVSNGTYIRSLVHEIGQRLKTGAYLFYLERTMVNGLEFVPDQTNLNPEFNLVEYEISLDNLKKLYYGQKLRLDKLSDENYLLMFQKNQVGILIVENNEIKKINLFGNKIKRILNDHLVDVKQNSSVK